MICNFIFDLMAYMKALSQATKTVHSKGEGPYLCLLVYVTKRKFIHRNKQRVKKSRITRLELGNSSRIHLHC